MGAGAGVAHVGVRTAAGSRRQRPRHPLPLRERVFERGFSTKPAGAEGRGVGLSLARSVVDDIGGSLTLSDGSPTTFRIVLPTEAS